MLENPDSFSRVWKKKILVDISDFLGPNISKSFENPVLVGLCFKQHVGMASYQSEA